MTGKNPVDSLNKWKWFFACLAWGLWGAAFVAISRLVVLRPHVSDSIPVLFSIISHCWWTGHAIYLMDSIDGFLYFPQCAILYTPFAALGSPTGHIAWRLFGMAIYCAGLWRLAKLVSPKHTALVFAFGSFAAIAPSIASLRCGQANLHIAGFLLNVTVELARRKWSMAALYLIVALAVKPIIFVALLLAAAVYRPMRWRLALGVAIFFLVPFATQNPHYVWEQYRAALQALHGRPARPGVLRSARHLLEPGVDHPAKVPGGVADRRRRRDPGVVPAGLALVAGAGVLRVCGRIRRRLPDAVQSPNGTQFVRHFQCDPGHSRRRAVSGQPAANARRNALRDRILFQLRRLGF